MREPTPSFTQHLDASILADIRALGAPGDDVLTEVIGMFLADVPRQVSALKAAIEAQDAPAARQHAHRLKGTALSMGAFTLASVCSAMEFAASAGAVADAAAHLSELEAEFAATCEALENQLN